MTPAQMPPAQVPPAQVPPAQVPPAQMPPAQVIETGAPEPRIRDRRSLLAETTWPYGLVILAMLFGLGLFALGIALQEAFRPRIDYGALLEAWIPVSPEQRSDPIPREPLAVASVAELRAAFAQRAYDLSPPDLAGQSTPGGPTPGGPTPGGPTPGGPAPGGPPPPFPASQAPASQAPASQVPASQVPAPVVPALALASLPGDLAALADAGDRKRLFLQSVLPLVLMANRAVRRVRAQVLSVEARLADEGTLSLAERDWLGALAALYGVAPGDLDALLERLDEVPVSIALAQAAVETGWGTSRFARQGNALYGARTWRRDLDGMVPLERDEDADFRVRRFGEPAESVWSYLHNLNSSPAYAEWRRQRAALRAAGEPLSAAALLDGLSRYSESGADYIALLGRLIEEEGLQRFAEARLATPLAAQTEPSAGPADRGPVLTKVESGGCAAPEPVSPAC